MTTLHEAAQQALMSRTAFTIVSILYCTYLSVAELGRTGSYWSLVQAAVMFYSIWMLGYCVARKELK